jgi:hypothetical protein
MLFSKEIGLVAAGVALGAVGVKAIKSQTAKRLCVQTVSKGLQIKAAGQDIIEQAKSNVDDIVAEASYLNQQEAEVAQAAAAAPAPAAAAPAPAPAAKASRRAPRKSAKKA